MNTTGAAATESKANQAYRILRERIVGGQYVPGYRIVISDLAKESGISASPWREAIRRLQAEGWLEVIPNVGARVAEPGLNAHRQTLELLARLEGLATSLAAPHLTQEDLGALHTINDQIRDSVAHDDESARFNLDRKFHELFRERCDFPRLSRMIASELERLDFIKIGVQFDPASVQSRRMSSVAEHDELLRLIESHAPLDDIEECARRHKLNALSYPHHTSGAQTHTNAD